MIPQDQNIIFIIFLSIWGRAGRHNQYETLKKNDPRDTIDTIVPMAHPQTTLTNPKPETLG